MNFILDILLQSLVLVTTVGPVMGRTLFNFSENSPYTEWFALVGMLLCTSIFVWVVGLGQLLKWIIS